MVVVSPLTPEAILGIDFLQGHGWSPVPSAVIDLGHKRLCLRESGFDDPTTTQLPGSTYSVGNLWSPDSHSNQKIPVGNLLFHCNRQLGDHGTYAAHGEKRGGLAPLTCACTNVNSRHELGAIQFVCRCGEHEFAYCLYFFDCVCRHIE